MSQAREVVPDLLLPLVTQDGNLSTKELGNKSAKTIEFWVDVQALGASGNYDLNFQTSVVEKDGGATKFVTQETINVIATGVVVVILNRIDHALGQKYRVNLVKNTTTITLEIKTVILE